MNCVYPAPEALLGDRLPERPNEDPTMRATRDPPRAPAPEILLRPPPQAHSPYRVHSCQPSSGPHGQRRKRKGTQQGYSTRRRETRLGQKKETGKGRLSGKAGRKTRDWQRVGTRDVCAVCSTWSCAPRVAGPGGKRGSTASPVYRAGTLSTSTARPGVPPAGRGDRAGWPPLPSAPKAPGTTSPAWPKGVSLDRESLWLVSLLILTDGRTGHFSGFFSAIIPSFTRTNRL